jgi:murein L,D-transpeptidase YafK
MYSLVLALLLLALPYSILIEKSKRELHVLKNGEIVKTYSVALGSSPIGPKERAGDRRTPEGSYWICAKNAKSNFHKSLEISYPNITNAERGLQAHRISEGEFKKIKRANLSRSEPPQHTALGGEIYIHGGGSLRSTGRDWTWGCIALDDADIDSLFAILPVGTEVKIVK